VNWRLEVEQPRTDLIAGGQCQKSKLVCGGYENSLTFVPFDPQRSTRPPLVPAQEEPSLGCGASVVALTRQFNSLNQTAFESRVLDDYWEIYFPKVNFAQQAAQFDELGSWVFSIQRSYPDEHVVKTSMLAVGFASLARRSGEKRFSVAAMESYSRVLLEVNRSLQDAERWKKDSVLATCKLLALYEVRIPLLSCASKVS
jgi:hypothetical protein